MSIKRIMDLDNRKLLFPINLQLFAAASDDDEDLEDGDLPFDDIEEESEPDDESEEDTEDDEVEDDEPVDQEEEPEPPKDKKKPDKITKALIAEKRARKELEKRLAEAEEKERRREQDRKDQERIDKLIDSGYGEEQAKLIVENDRKNLELERKLNRLEFKELERECPGISNHMNEILELERRTGMSKEEIWKARFSKQSEFDKKTKIEQEALYRQKNGQAKKGKTGADPKVEKGVKLSQEDQRAYDLLRKNKQYANLTKSEYLKIMEEEEIIED